MIGAPAPPGFVNGVYGGDGHKMGLWVGAAWQRITPNAPMLLAMFSGNTAPQPYMAPPCLVVNANGQRFFNEDCGTGAMAGSTIMNQPGQKAFAIWDSTYAQAAAPWYGFGSYYGPEPGQESPPMAVADVVNSWDTAAATSPPTIAKANTIADLATALGLPADALAATVSRYNSFCASGVDTDFGKRPGCLYPVNTPPFYASTGGIWLLIVTGGLSTNANLQVLDTNDQVIPGLYAVGTLVGDMYEGIYTFVLPGHNLGATCDTFGYVAGQYIVANETGS